MAKKRLKLQPLDALASEIVRRRAIQRVGGCEYCLRGKSSWKELQCSHYVGRRNRQVRWDLDNLKGLCGACHMFLDANPHVHKDWVEIHLGNEAYDRLITRSQGTGKVFLEDVYEKLKESVKRWRND